MLLGEIIDLSDYSEGLGSKERDRRLCRRLWIVIPPAERGASQIQGWFGVYLSSLSFCESSGT
jgi:hypothetical protein